ncbi:MAG: GlsB/YeaQ/YmgE family stress response membrane protein [Planctomycetaceae bacterium]|nr:GlsB/YeaQ/YmgE family stress response membrane protein [Planctomycetaceae bacterium]
MGILSWIVFGLIAGVVAKYVMPGPDSGGIVLTILLGVAGAVVGGFIGAQLLGYGSVTGFDVRSLLIAIGGALVLLVGFRLVLPQLTA